MWCERVWKGIGRKKGRREAGDVGPARKAKDENSIRSIALYGNYKLKLTSLRG